MSLEDIRNERLKKLELLKERGIDPFPAESHRTHSIADALRDFESLSADKKKVTVAGRVMALREHGALAFADLDDGSTPVGIARLQMYFKKDEMDPALFDLFLATADTGDFVEFTGVLLVTKRGAKSVQVESWRMLAKSLLPLPDSWYGLEDKELRLRARHLDMVLNPEIREMFMRKARFWNAIREFLTEKGYLEVETPAIETTPGGADARPFVTHHNALDIEAYLRISAGELWQKRLLVAGFPKVFEIGRIFRNEGISNEHLQDYTQCEFYEAYSDYTKGMSMIRDLYQHVAKKVYGKMQFSIRGHEVDLEAEWKTLHFGETIKEHFGIDPVACTEEEAIAAAKKAKVDLGKEPNKARAIDHLWKSIRKGIAGPAFLVGVPVFLEPLAKRVPGKPDEVERFQVILAGSEIGKGFSELNNPLDQRERFLDQEKMREAGDDEAQRLDEEYIKAMEHGMPPAFGFGVSERLFAFLEDKSAHETQLFPLLRPKS
ncbi:MAG: lysine--tRNA ligase [Patescibacteria group bacterium]